MTDRQQYRERDHLFAFRGSRAELAHAGRQTAPDLSFRSVLSAGPVEPVAQKKAFAERVKPGAETWALELASISESVPAFAIWQIATLEHCFRRYCNILQVAGRDVRFRRNCIMLMANAERISQTLDAARETRQWPPFNRAAFELRQDCEQLAALVAEAI